MGILFNRTKKPEPAPAPDDLGTANIAKQVQAQTVTVQRHGVTTTQHVSQPVVDGHVVTNSVAPASEDGQADLGEPIYQFESTTDAHQRGRGWFIGMAIVFSLLVALNIILHLYMSAVVIALLSLILFTNATRKNKQLIVRFYASGLGLNQQFFPWREFSKFWILYEPPTLKQLHFARRTKLINEITIELAGENPLKIRDMLLPLLAEDATKEESRVDLVTRTFKL